MEKLTKQEALEIPEFRNALEMSNTDYATITGDPPNIPEDFYVLLYTGKKSPCFQNNIDVISWNWNEMHTAYIFEEEEEPILA